VVAVEGERRTDEDELDPASLDLAAPDESLFDEPGERPQGELLDALSCDESEAPAAPDLPDLPDLAAAPAPPARDAPALAPDLACADPAADAVLVDSDADFGASSPVTLAAAASAEPIAALEQSASIFAESALIFIVFAFLSSELNCACDDAVGSVRATSNTTRTRNRTADMMTLRVECHPRAKGPETPVWKLPHLGQLSTAGCEPVAAA
jgi:hypothetical protein